MQSHNRFLMEVAMSGIQDLLFGLLFCGALTALIATVAVVRGRQEARENERSEEWMQETIRRAS